MVLEALGTPHIHRISERCHVLLVRREDARFAAAQLDRYRRENRGWPPHEVHTPLLADGAGATILYCAVLVCAFVVQSGQYFGVDWTAAGRSVSDQILAGRWWRAATSLCLHADVVHLAGNLAFGAVFVAIACQLLGSGAGMLAIVLSGTLGNLLNADLRGPGHQSLGASTAVFGALGLLAAFQWRLRLARRFSRLRRWTPPAVGLAFLGYLGMSGERTDVLAHVTGFGFGLAIGAALGAPRPRAILRRPAVQLACGALAPLLILVCWWLALAAVG